MNEDLILAKLQENPFLTGRELGDILNISVSTANRYIRKYSDKTFSERLAERNRRTCTGSPIEISKLANQVILGSLLGDGSIVRKRTNCLFTELHSAEQEEYVKYKYDLLKEGGLEVKLRHSEGYVSYIDGRPIKNNGRVYLVSKVNQTFNKYREEWYADKKIVPDSVYELNSLGLAIWFMDDGTSNISSFYLSTQGFSYPCQEKLVDMMRKNFNIECHIHKQKDTYVLYIAARDKQKFIDIVKPYLCQSMNYKIVGHNKQGELLES